MDWSFIQKFTPMYVEAAWLTLVIGVLGIVLSIAIGLICAWVKYYKVPVARQIVAVYIELSRNTPLIVQLFFLYFGLPKAGILLSSEACGVIGLAFLGGSYMAESFLSGLKSVNDVQLESAESLGLHRWQIMRYIVLPQAAQSLSPLWRQMLSSFSRKPAFSARFLLQTLCMLQRTLSECTTTQEKR